MKTIRTYLVEADAQIARALLESEGIQASILDENASRLGWGLAPGGIRIQVADEDYERAEAILAGKGGSTALPDDFVPPPSPLPDAPDRSNLSAFWALVALILALGAVLALGLRQHRLPTTSKPAASAGVLASGIGYTVDEDSDGDGKNDTFYHYDGRDTLRRCEIDRNQDGLIDQWFLYDASGKVEKYEEDQNFDGMVDIRGTFRHGQIADHQIDADFNGRPDHFATYVHGVLTEEAVKEESTGRMIRRYRYQDGVLAEEWEDTDGNGTLDVRYTYTPMGERSDAQKTENGEWKIEN